MSLLGTVPTVKSCRCVTQVGVVTPQYVYQVIRIFVVSHQPSFSSQRYLLHLLYPDTFPFSDEALLGNEDIFIPSGWDSEALIDSILLEDWAKSSSFNDVRSNQWAAEFSGLRLS